MGRMIIKRIKPTMAEKKLYNFGRQSTMRSVYKTQEEPKMIETKEEPKEIKNDTVMMTTNEKIELANAVLSEKPQTIAAKRIRKDKGLIERKENTIILTEDNRELLKD